MHPLFLLEEEIMRRTKIISMAVSLVLVFSCTAYAAGINAPGGVKARGISQTQITITWKSVKTADRYIVYVYDANTDKYKVLAKVTGLSYTHKGLKPSTKKAYRVSAARGKSESAKSAKAVGTTHMSDTDKLLAVAKRKVGSKYKWGASGPSSFDCSGFIYYCFREAGVGRTKVKRSTALGEYNQLKKYKVGSKRAGDIIFFSSNGKQSGINHAGIYAGNGYIIHAANSDRGVCVSKMIYMPKAYAVVRNI